MNKTKLKSYAPQARRDFIDMVTSRAAQLGIAEHHASFTAAECIVQGDVAIIAGQAFPASIAVRRKQLIERIQKHGFAGTMDAIAYTWFNRFAALRYMELKDGFIPHGQRVLSSTNLDSLPDILAHALELSEAGDLPGVTPAMVAELKLANKDGELYKRLLVAQCNSLSFAIPFLFEHIDDDSELLLPDNLLRSDSVIRKLVESIDEEDWQQVEIIGWLYQFYISEKKDQVIGKVVKSEDIPAATQLFTPNWIVKYLVQNSVGRLWMQANPDSTLASQWEYYIRPAEQTLEVQAQLDALIQTRVAEDGDTLNPESITVLDPACGSGHILVEAYDILKSIYQERGYRERDIPRLILEKNLSGIDIDDRAAQLAGFALLMKARADDRRLFENTPALNVMALQDSKDLDAETMADTVMHAAIQLEGGDAIPSGQLFGGGELNTQHSSGLNKNDLHELITCFVHAKTFGSLITVPAKLVSNLSKLAMLLEKVIAKGDDLSKSYAAQIQSDFLKPAYALSKEYDAVVANPPYMGNSYFNDLLGVMLSTQYVNWSGDLFTCFIKKSIRSLKRSGVCSLITIGTWTFLKSFADMRKELLNECTLISLVDNGRGVWGSDHGSFMFAAQKSKIPSYICQGRNLSVGKGKVQSQDQIRERFLTCSTEKIEQQQIELSPDRVIAVGASSEFMSLLNNCRKLSDIADVRQGIKTGEIDKFMRFWFEVDYLNIFFNCQTPAISELDKRKWYPCNKGGEFRKWYGNLDQVLNWKYDGFEIKNFKDLNGKLRSRPQNIQYFFREGVTWSTVTMGKPSFRFSETGRVFESGGSTMFFKENEKCYFALGVLNSFIGELAVGVLSPKVSLGEGAVSKFLVPEFSSEIEKNISENAIKLVSFFKRIESGNERSPEFKAPTLFEFVDRNIACQYETLVNSQSKILLEIINLERENDELIGSNLNLKLPAMKNNSWEDYGVKNFDRSLLSEQTVAYSIGCMMGRYSLDEPGLIYAHAGNLGFDPTRYNKFPADADGIVPVSDIAWFPDDATNRVKEFLRVIWGEASLEENMLWLADSLGRKNDESAEEAIRRYIATSFFKDHCQTYKKRPIYWLFSSGKHKAFECLVYLHRYNEGTLARMRAEYVVPLTGKIAERIKLLEEDASKAASTAAKKKLDKDIAKLKSKVEELRLYDEKLRHYADMRINLDLDDGVKVNYGKFGDLLDGVKAIAGGADED